MRKFPLRTVGISAGILVGFALLNSYVFKSDFFTGSLGSPGSYLFEKSRSIATWFQGIERWRTLIQENNDLKRQNADLLVLASRLSDVEEENTFLRGAARVAEKVPGHFISASLFTVTLDASGHQTLINKGRQDGIQTGQVVVSGEGILVGRIKEVFDTTSRADLIKDPTFEITAKVSGGTTTGLVRGNLSKGLLFDLIAQEEEIKEGDTIVSTGSDQFPAALLIGEVDHVEVNETKIFKEVRIKPAMDVMVTGRVLVIRTP